MTKKEKQDYFLSLYEPIHDRFERFCRARVYGRMEYQDLMNDTLLIAFQKMDVIENKSSFLSFLIGISVRVLANHKRKKKEELIDFSNENEMNSITDLNADTTLSSDVQILYKAIAMLPQDQGECILLFEISGMSIKEIVKIQKCSESTVKQRLRRGRNKLKEALLFESVSPIKEGNDGRK